jgi:hypothetical protein
MASERRYCQFCGTQIWSIDHGSHVCPTERLEGIFVSAAVVDQVRAWRDEATIDAPLGESSSYAPYAAGKRDAFVQVLAIIEPKEATT